MSCTTSGNLAYTEETVIIQLSGDDGLADLPTTTSSDESSTSNLYSDIPQSSKYQTQTPHVKSFPIPQSSKYQTPHVKSFPIPQSSKYQTQTPHVKSSPIPQSSKYQIQTPHVKSFPIPQILLHNLKSQLQIPSVSNPSPTPIYSPIPTTFVHLESTPTSSPTSTSNTPNNALTSQPPNNPRTSTPTSSSTSTSNSHNKRKRLPTATEELQQTADVQHTMSVVKQFLETRINKKDEWEGSRNYGFCCTLAKNLDGLPLNSQIRIQKAILEVFEQELDKLE